MQHRFILASGSPRRRELIVSLGLPFEIITPDIDESRLPDEPSRDYVRRLSQQKARAVAASLNEDGALVLAADTVVVLAADTIGVLSDVTEARGEDGDILGKPPDAAAARSTLRRLRDRAHVVCTAFTLLPVGDPAAAITDIVRTRVTMRPYTDADIEAYIAAGEPFDKAGGYAI
jgi:septum formation protein